MFHHDSSPLPILPDDALVVLSSTSTEIELKISPLQDLDSADANIQCRALRSLATVIKQAHPHALLTLCDSVLAFELHPGYSPYECDRLTVNMNLIPKVLHHLEEDVGGEEETVHGASCPTLALDILAHLITTLSRMNGGDVNALRLFLELFPTLAITVCRAAIQTSHRSYNALPSVCLQYLSPDVADSLLQFIVGFIEEGQDAKTLSTAVDVFNCCSPAALKLSTACEEMLHQNIQKMIESAVLGGTDIFGEMAPLEVLFVHYGGSHLAKNTATMEAFLQFGCFHPDQWQKNHCLKFIAQIATPDVMKELFDAEDQTPLEWWTDRCLPTWVDVLSAHALEPIDLGLVGGADFVIEATLHRLLTVPRLFSVPHMPDISHFAMKLFDCGGLAKLQAVANYDHTPVTTFHKLLSYMRGGRIAERLELIPWSFDGASPEHRSAVCAVFSAPLYKHPRTGEHDRLPGEVAHHICSYLPTRMYFKRKDDVMNELQPKSDCGKGFGKQQQTPAAGNSFSSGFGKQQQTPAAGNSFGSGFGKQQQAPAAGNSFGSGFGKQQTPAAGNSFGSGLGKQQQAPAAGNSFGSGFGKQQQAPAAGNSFKKGFGKQQQAPAAGNSFKKGFGKNVPDEE